MPKLYVLVGVPASGKSTWVADQEWAKDCAYICTDVHVENYAKSVGKTYSEVFKDYMPTAIDLMMADVRHAQKECMDVIWDQTSTTVASRARKFNSLPGYYKIAVVFKTPVKSVLEARLESRPGKVIPKEVVEQMALDLEMEPPSEEEGFDEIWNT
jgi:predicted kinase